MSLFIDIQVPEAVVRQAQAGDVAAHRQLYLLLGRPVYTLLLRLVASPSVAEDLLHDVFVELLRGVHRYRAEGSFGGWVRSIAVSKALMHLRSPWHRRFLPHIGDELPAVAEHAGGAQEWRQDLERALGALQPLTRSIVWLHDVEGYTHPEIARLFGRSVSFSKSQLARAHEQLRDLLEPQSGAFPCMPLSKT